jgi:hypothetical protein
VRIVGCDPQVNLSEAFGWYADANMIAARMRETDALQRAAVELRPVSL